MADELWINMTDAQLKAWETVKHSRAGEAGRANLTQARQMIDDYDRANVDRSNLGRDD